MASLRAIASRLLCVWLASLGTGCQSDTAAMAPRAASADREARAIAEGALEAMGGMKAWQQTRLVSWSFFGGRRHVWDKWTGDLRIESEERVCIMNLETRTGRVFDAGVELEGQALQEALERGRRMWINDSYWMFLPYKLLDPGVQLRHTGRAELADGRPADVLELTFDSVGVTPDNRYEVFVALDSGLVEQWSFYERREDEEPGFTLPWTGWQRYGEILLASDHGRGKDWNIAVHSSVPEGSFEVPTEAGF